MQPEPAHGLGATRTRVLALLQDAGEALSAAEVGQRLGVHPNSARFHLEGLTGSGHVLRRPEERPARGRPRMMYAASSRAPDGAGRRYRVLAETLAGILHDRVPDAAAVAESAGRRLAADLSPGHGGGELEAAVAAVDVVGFDSRLVEDAEAPRLEISHCPFLEVADGHRDVVCSLHLGLLRGAVETAGSTTRVRALRPLVEPGRCVAELARR